MSDTLMINEIFYSIQGESTWSGLPCTFIRLTGCHLRCHYCDTEYAFFEGHRRKLDQIMAEVMAFACDLVEVTGGEPLLQPNVHALMSRLADAGKTVLLETSGACDISTCDPRVIRIVDVKTPDSGEADHMLWGNLEALHQQDEVKFVICSRRDYEWARDVIGEYHLHERAGAVLLSAAAPVARGDQIRGTDGQSIRDLAEWVMADRLAVRIQTQLHKLIFYPLTRGV